MIIKLNKEIRELVDQATLLDLMKELDLQDAKGIAEFARIQSEFEETEIESAINDCVSSNYKNCPFL